MKDKKKNPLNSYFNEATWEESGGADDIDVRVV